MANYPDSIYEPREKEQRSGVEYVPEKKSVIFVEDVKKLDDEVVAIETDLIERIKQYPKRAAMFHDEMTVLTGGAIWRIHHASQDYAFFCGIDSFGNGDSFTHSFFLKAGTYIFTVLGCKDNEGGKLDWYLDDVLIASGEDHFSGPFVYNTIWTYSNIVVVGDGYHVLKGVTNGKNPSSGGYDMFLTKFWLKPATDPARE